VISPKISILIPTLNCAKSLKLCLQSIKSQKYSNYEIIIADGGSTDNTLSIAKEYKCKIYFNPLKTAEAGKAVALNKATGELVALIDSDNILPTADWLSKMVFPFLDQDIIASEPIRFTYRRHSGFIERYSALLGANDPLAYFMGIYDRFSTLSSTWTGIKLKTINRSQYLKIKIDNLKKIPTIGANGTLFKTN
jgi:glycosyltransferase involved in cell wall biosynthesis